MAGVPSGLGKRCDLTSAQVLEDRASGRVAVAMWAMTREKRLAGLGAEIVSVFRTHSQWAWLHALQSEGNELGDSEGVDV